MQRPAQSEYGDYYHLYVSQVPDGNIFDILRVQPGELDALLAGASDDKADYRYAPEKWSLKEVLGHVIDVERMFSFRAFAFARREPAELPSMEQDDYAAATRYADRPLADIVTEYRTVRVATLALFETFDDTEWGRQGRASGFEFSVRSFPFIIAGHQIHHMKVLNERYLDRE